MFGLGRNSQEQTAINAFAIQLEQIGLPERDAVTYATKLIDETLAELRQNGIDPFKSTQGNEQVLKEPVVSPRLAVGLTVDDIRNHWNRPLVLVFGEVKLRELFNFVVVNIADQQGKDLIAAGNHYKKAFPRYGDPRKWDPTNKYNAGLLENDAVLFPELAGRVDTWQRRVGPEYIQKAIEQHGTLNAAIRSELASGTL